MVYYSLVRQNEENLKKVLSYYSQEYEEARKDTYINGSLEQCIAQLPGITAYRCSQLQDLEAILEYYTLKLKLTRASLFRSYKEKYSRSLTSSETEKYIDGEPEVTTLQGQINGITLVRNLYLSIMKGLEAKNFQLNNIVKLKTAGIDDAEVLTNLEQKHDIEAIKRQLGLSDSDVAEEESNNKD